MVSPPPHAPSTSSNRFRQSLSGHLSFRSHLAKVPILERYRSRISGPLLDRIDLHVEVPALSYEEIASAPAAEGTEVVRVRVERARDVQRDRLRAAGLHCNAQMGAREVREHCRHDAACGRLLEGAMRGLGLSARGYSKVLKVSRTIADLAEDQVVRSSYVAEALQYRSLDRH